MHYFNNFETKFFMLQCLLSSSKSTFSLVFWDLSNIDLFFTFLSIDFQPWVRVRLRVRVSVKVRVRFRVRVRAGLAHKYVFDQV